MPSRVLGNFQDIQVASLYRLSDATESCNIWVFFMQVLEVQLHFLEVVVDEFSCGETVQLVTCAPAMLCMGFLIRGSKLTAANVILKCNVTMFVV